MLPVDAHLSGGPRDRGRVRQGLQESGLRSPGFGGLVSHRVTFRPSHQSSFRCPAKRFRAGGGKSRPDHDRAVRRDAAGQAGKVPAGQVARRVSSVTAAKDFDNVCIPRSPSAKARVEDSRPDGPRRRPRVSPGCHRSAEGCRAGRSGQLRLVVPPLQEMGDLPDLEAMAAVFQEHNEKLS